MSSWWVWRIAIVIRAIRQSLFSKVDCKHKKDTFCLEINGLPFEYLKLLSGSWILDTKLSGIQIPTLFGHLLNVLLRMITKKLLIHLLLQGSQPSFATLNPSFYSQRKAQLVESWIKQMLIWAQLSAWFLNNLCIKLLFNLSWPFTQKTGRNFASETHG